MPKKGGGGETKRKEKFKNEREKCGIGTGALIRETWRKMAIGPRQFQAHKEIVELPAEEIKKHLLVVTEREISSSPVFLHIGEQV